MTATIDGSTGIDKVQPGSVGKSCLTTESVPVGVDQTWQNVGGSRVAGTTYTNSTGRPIALYICISTTSTRSNVQVVLNSTLTFQGTTAYTSGDYSNITLIIPNGATYSLNAATVGSVVNWYELR